MPGHPVGNNGKKLNYVRSGFWFRLIVLTQNSVMFFFYHHLLSLFSTRRLFSREATFSFVGVAYHVSKCDADKGKSRFARKTSPSGKRDLGTMLDHIELTYTNWNYCQLWQRFPLINADHRKDESHMQFGWLGTWMGNLPRIRFRIRFTG